MRILLASWVFVWVVSPARADEPVLRVGIAARPGPHSHLTPLVYWGGFQTKTAIYDGLVRFGPKGVVQPALAKSWEVAPDGRAVTFLLRGDARFHDGSAVTAQSVADHFTRWLGNPGNRWLGSTVRIEQVEVLGDLRLRVRLREPWPLLEECAGAINPAFIVGPGAYSHEGAFVRAVGAGPYRLVETRSNESYSLEAQREGVGFRKVELVILPTGYAESDAPLALLRRGAIHLVADTSGPILAREALPAFERDSRFRVWTGSGSATTLLVFNTTRGLFAQLEWRRRAAAAIDRDALVRRGELGYADPATTLFMPGWAGWPESGKLPAAGRTGGKDQGAVLLLVADPSPRLLRHARLLAQQVAGAGVILRVEIARDKAAYKRRVIAGEYDAIVKSTYGVPYDPYITLQTLFLDRPKNTAASSPPVWRDATLRGALLKGFTSPRAADRRLAFAAVQARIDDQVPLVPLFRSRRIAVSVAGLRGVQVGPDGYDLRLDRISGELPAAPGPEPVLDPKPTADPRKGEVPLPTVDPDWNAFLVLDNRGTGIWTVKSFKVFPTLGCPEIVGLDDKGICHIMVSYSGKWTPRNVIADGKWLGGLAHGDIDPRIDGAELYAGSQRGNIFQVVAYPHGALDNRLIAHIEGREIHTLVAGERELIVFTRPGGLYRLTPTGKDGRFETTKVEDLPGRVRDAVRLNTGEIATVGRAGRLRLLRLTGKGAQWTTIYRGAMGKGRVALRPGKQTVLYTTHDDGRVLRHERTGANSWKSEVIYLGPQGPRGLAAGRFDTDPAVETVAVFGYSGKLQMLSRRPGEGWKVKTIFRDIDKGHWLGVAEVEGRNATDEIVASGFGGRIVLLSRPPGYGLTAPTDDDG